MNAFVTDKEVARLLQVAPSTITRVMRGQFKGKAQPLVGAKPIFVGGGRRWNVVTLANALGLTVEEIREVLG